MWTTKTSTAGSKPLQTYSKLKEFEVDLNTKDSVCIYMQEDVAFNLVCKAVASSIT